MCACGVCGYYEKFSFFAPGCIVFRSKEKNTAIPFVKRDLTSVRAPRKFSKVHCHGTSGLITRAIELNAPSVGWGVLKFQDLTSKRVMNDCWVVHETDAALVICACDQAFNSRLLMMVRQGLLRDSIRDPIIP